MILLSIVNRVATLTLNRPDKRNALNDEMAQQLLDHLNQLSVNDDCKVLIIKANGEAFCAGADMAYLQKLQNNSYEENLNDSLNLMSMFKALNEFPKITIAQVEGPAFAGGCGLAGLCDFVYAIPESLFAYTEVKIGFIPAIVSVFLGLKIGENAAKQMLLSGNVYTAEQAKAFQLVTHIVEKDKIESEVLTFAVHLTETVSSQSIQHTKALLNNIKGHTLTEQLDMAAKANAMARATEDCKKGLAAFLKKEKLSW